MAFRLWLYSVAAATGLIDPIQAASPIARARLALAFCSRLLVIGALQRFNTPAKHDERRHRQDQTPHQRVRSNRTTFCSRST